MSASPLNLKSQVLLCALLASLALGCTVTATESVEIGNKAVLCLTVTAYDASGATLTKYWVFRVEIDRLSSLRLSQLASALSGFSAVNATVLVQFQNQGSGLTQLVLDTSLNLKRDFLSVVVNTIEGAYQSVVADNWCQECPVCHESQCFDSYDSAYSSKDLAVIVTWAGSDASKNDYLSSATRPSRLSLYSVDSLYSRIQAMI